MSRTCIKVLKSLKINQHFKTMSIIRLPEVIHEEFVRKLKNDKEVDIEKVGKFRVTEFSKGASLIPKKSGEMRVMKNKNFSRIGFKATPSLKKAVR